MFRLQFMVSFWRPGLFSVCPPSSNPLAVKLSQAHSWKASTVRICVCPDPTNRLSWLSLVTAGVIWTVKVVPISIILCQPTNSTPFLFATFRICLAELANWSLRTLDKPGCPPWSLRYSRAFWNFIYYSLQSLMKTHGGIIRSKSPDAFGNSRELQQMGLVLCCAALRLVCLLPRRDPPSALWEVFPIL